MMYERDEGARASRPSEVTASTSLEPGSDRRIGFITSGPAYMHVREAFPNAPVLKLGFSYPLPLRQGARAGGPGGSGGGGRGNRAPGGNRTATPHGIAVHGKDILPTHRRTGARHAATRDRPAAGRSAADAPTPLASAAGVSPAAHHVRRLPAPRRLLHARRSSATSPSSGDIGCYTLGAGHPLERARHHASRWAPRWAWRWAWTRVAASPTRASASSP
ncbi:MAG: hypothetical protein MZW92_11775 [Comamonadaceae bacterium]|nr:hypothetical protein [Comamonadaceae bacterium]